MTPSKRGALLCYAAAMTAIVLGLAAAVARYPGDFDWAYTVISHLASPRRNPDGGSWLAASLLVAVVLLWPVTSHYRRIYSPGGSAARLSVTVLRVGLAGGVLLGLEGVLVLDYSRHLDRAHELLALVTFLGFYGGVLGLYAHRLHAHVLHVRRPPVNRLRARRMRDAVGHLLPAVLVVLPLLAVGVTQLLLYLEQRDVGWVGTDWREMGVPVWLSFAFWQWFAVLFLGIGLGHLVAADDPSETAAGEPSAEGTTAADRED